MKNLLASLLMTIMVLIVTTVFCQAAIVENNSQLLCAITEVIECNELGECAELTTEDAGLPDFVLIDLEAKKLLEARTDSIRETWFNTSSTPEGLTILSGVDGLRGWSAVLSANNTQLTASISDELAGFIVFGACRDEL